MPDRVEEELLQAGFWLSDWHVQPLLNRVSCGDREVPVEPKVMEVLLCLARQPGRTVTKDRFLEEVWAGTVVTDDVLSRCISELRKVFGDDSRDPRFIETIRKTGYRLIAPLSLRHNDASVASSGGAAVHPGRPGRHTAADRATTFAAIGKLLQRRTAAWVGPRMAPVVLWGIALVGVVVLLGGYFLYWNAATGDAEAPPTTRPFTSFPGLELDPMLSPNGEKVVYARKGDAQDDFDVYIGQLGAEVPLQITGAGADERYPAWSPDGLHVAFARSTPGEHSLIIIPSIGGSERRVADFGARRIGGLAWSPQGNTFAVAAQSVPYGAYRLFQAAVDGAAVRPWTSPPPTIHGDLAPAFSPDGTRLAFTRMVDDEVQDIFVLNDGRPEPRQLTFDSTRVAGLAWTPDGKEIVFASARGGVWGLWRVAADGGAPAWIASASKGSLLEHPTLSYQKNQLAYVERSSNTNIWRYRRRAPSGARREEPLIFSTRWDSNPDVAPDGSRIAFVSDQSGFPEVWLCDAEGGNMVQVTAFEQSFTSTPRWSPDGRQLAFVSRSEGHADIYTIDAEGRRARRLTTAPADDVTPSWSRDTLSVYFSSNRSGSWQIWKMPADSGAAVQVTRQGGRSAFESPDGKLLYYVKPDTAGIWQLPLNGPEDTEAPGTGYGDAPPRDSPSVDSLSVDSLGADALTAMPPSPEGTLVVGELDPGDWGSWVVVQDGIYFVRRGPGNAEIAFFRFSTRQATRVASIGDIPLHPSLAVAPDGSWILFTQVDDNEGDIILVEQFR